MTKKIELVLNKIYQKIEPEKDKLTLMKENLNKIVSELNKEISRQKIDAEIFIGGSFAKNTLIKKDKYDADLFVRFSKKYSEEDLTKLLKKILRKFKGISEIHGSRDYYQIKINDYFFIELIPVIKITKPAESKNITDLSYLHVKYVNKKASNKILEEIKIAKAFCQAKGVYGAESYIKGFSGYSLELLIIYFKNFENLLKAISKMKNEKLIIDIEKHFRDKNTILMDLNSSKLESPIILIDPTYKYRNALSALSKETFLKFQIEARKFLKSPSEKEFEIKKINLKEIKEKLKKDYEMETIEIETKKQEGDIAGSKLKKFYAHLSSEISKYFIINKKGFNYSHKKSAKCFFVGKKKSEILIEGPLLVDEKNVKKFRLKHKNTFEKNKRIYSRKKINFRLKEFIKEWKVKNKKKIKDMDISEFKVN